MMNKYNLFFLSLCLTGIDNILEDIFIIVLYVRKHQPAAILCISQNAFDMLFNTVSILKIKAPFTWYAKEVCVIIKNPAAIALHAKT